jgi:hypothetical protein
VALYISVWPRRRHVVGDGADVVDEAHVEHPVGLVENEHLDVADLGLAGLQVVEQAARRRDQDVERTAQRLQLRAVGHAADDGGDAQPRHVAAVGLRRLGDLDRELARRRQHEDARAVHDALLAPLGGIGARGEDALQRRQHERGGLAAAGGGGDHQVGAGDRRRDRGGLDRRRRVVAGIVEGAGHGLGQAEGFESHGVFSVVVERGRCRLRAARSKARRLEGRCGKSRSVLRMGATASPPTCAEFRPTRGR